MGSREGKLLRVSPRLLKELKQYRQDEINAGCLGEAEILYQTIKLIEEYKKLLEEKANYIRGDR